MKFAFLIMGDFDCKIDNAQIGNGSAQIVGVSNLEEAVFAAKELYENGIDAVLIGELLMRKSDRKAALMELKQQTGRQLDMN